MRYQVIVGNVGAVADTADKKDAQSVMSTYVALSKSRYGRVSGETVVMMGGEDIIEQYTPPAYDLVD